MDRCKENLSQVLLEKFQNQFPITTKAKLSNIQYYCKRQPSRAVPYFIQNYDSFYTMFLNMAFETIYYLNTTKPCRDLAILDSNYLSIMGTNYILIVNHTERRLVKEITITCTFNSYVKFSVNLTGTEVAFAGGGRKFYIVDYILNTCDSYPLDKGIYGMCYIPNTKFLLFSTYDGQICGFNTERRTQIFEHKFHNFTCYDLLSWGDNKCISCSSDSKSCLQIIELSNKFPYYKIINTVKGAAKKDNIRSLCMLSEGIIVTGSKRGIIRVRNVKTPSCISLRTIKIANNNMVWKIVRIAPGIISVRLRSGVVKIICTQEKEGKLVFLTLNGTFLRINYS